MSLETAEFFREIFPFSSPPRITVRGGSSFFDPDSIRITDTTLRDGQQGWRSFTVEEALSIYEVLVDLGGGGGITTTELFLYTSRDREIARKIREYGYKYPEPIAWIRATREDLRLVLDSGLEATVILASISDYHIYYKFRSTRERVFEKYLSVIEEALRHGIRVKCTLEDVTRASLEDNIIPFINKLLRLGEKYGTEIIVKLADTLGLGLPFSEVSPPRSIPLLIREIITRTGISGRNLEFHGHNDLGLVVANHLAAWIHGAALSNCTLFGIGERAGNCPLEIMLLHYVGLRGSSTGVNLKAIPRAASLLRSMGLNIPSFQPLAGENAFKTKAGIHVDGLIKNPELYLPFNPIEVLGVPYGVAITPHSGRSAIALWINTRGISRHAQVSKDDPRVIAIYNEIVRLFEEEGRREPLSDEEMYRIVEKYFSLESSGEGETALGSSYK